MVYRGSRVVSRSVPYRGQVVNRYYTPVRYGRDVYYRYYPRYVDYAPHVCRYYYDPYYSYWDPFYDRWTWIRSPWWDRYGYYYRPYVYYRSPTWWLTDYIFVSYIFRPYYSAYDYDRGYGEGYGDGYRDGYRDAQVSERTKEQIRRQVEEEIRQNQNDGQLPPSLIDKLNDPNYVFMVSEPITTVPMNRSSQACTLSEGDLLNSIQAPRNGEPFARMKVLTSKQESCQAGSEVLISLEDLQKFQNEFSETIEEGMQRLESQQSKIN